MYSKTKLIKPYDLLIRWAYDAPINLEESVGTYYINLSTDASNGASYYLESSSGDNYYGGTYYKSSSDEGKDLRFKISGYHSDDFSEH